MSCLSGGQFCIAPVLYGLELGIAPVLRVLDLCLAPVLHGLKLGIKSRHLCLVLRLKLILLRLEFIDGLLGIIDLIQPHRLKGLQISQGGRARHHIIPFGSIGVRGIH